MRSYRVRVLNSTDDLIDRLLKSGWRKVLGSDEWLVVDESDEQVRAELARVIPDRQVEIEELPADGGYMLSVGLD